VLARLAICDGGVEEARGEPGQPAVAPDGAGKSGEGLGEIIRATAMTKQGAQATTIQAPQRAAQGPPKRGPSVAPQVARPIPAAFHDAIALLPTNTRLPTTRPEGGKVYRRFTFSLPDSGCATVKPAPAGLAAPVLDLFVVIGGGNLRRRERELHGAGGLLDLPAQTAGQRKQLRRGQRRQVAPPEFGFHALQLPAQVIDAVRGGGQPLGAERLQFDGLEVLDFELMLVTPGDECQRAVKTSQGWANENQPL
jgi:hypothetical protein